eukprot:2050974-Rhodomonas_salina.1
MQQALDRHSVQPPTDATLGADTIVGEVDQLQRPAWSNASRTLHQRVRTAELGEIDPTHRLSHTDSRGT